MQTMDPAAKRSAARVKQAGRDTAARNEPMFLSAAKRFGHHGVANLIETIRQRERITITEAYARDLLARSGYPSPKD